MDTDCKLYQNQNYVLLTFNLNLLNSSKNEAVNLIGMVRKLTKTKTVKKKILNHKEKKNFLQASIINLHICSLTNVISHSFNQ